MPSPNLEEGSSPTATRHRVHTVSRFGYGVSALVHGIDVVLFALVGSSLLALYNVLSTALFLLLLFVAVERAWYRSAILLTTLEFNLHALLTMALHGVEIGFHLSLFGVASFLPFMEVLGWRTRLSLMGASLVTHLLGIVLSHGNPFPDSGMGVDPVAPRRHRKLHGGGHCLGLLHACGRHRRATPKRGP